MATINELAERCSERLNVGGASNGATRPRKCAKTAGWVPHAAIFFQEVATRRPFLFLQCGGADMPKRKKETKKEK